MGMTAVVADYPWYAETVRNLATIPEIDQTTVIISMDMAVAFAATYWTGLQFGSEMADCDLKGRF